MVPSGRRIGLANWTPEGFIGRLFKTIGAHVPPPAGVRSPALWGAESHLVTLFGPKAQESAGAAQALQLPYRSADHFLQVFRDYYGPTHKAFGALDPAGQAALS